MTTTTNTTINPDRVIIVAYYDNTYDRGYNYCQNHGCEWIDHWMHEEGYDYCGEQGQAALARCGATRFFFID